MQLSSSQDSGSLPRLEMVAEGLVFDARHAEAEEATNYNGSLLPLASGALLAGWQCVYRPGCHYLERQLAI